MTAPDCCTSACVPPQIAGGSCSHGYALSQEEMDAAVAAVVWHRTVERGSTAEEKALAWITQEYGRQPNDRDAPWTASLAALLDAHAAEAVAEMRGPKKGAP